MLDITLRDLVSGSVGAAISSVIWYFLKRKVERRREVEGLDIDQKRMDLIDDFLSRRDKWEASGQYVEIPKSIAGHIIATLSPKQWTDAYSLLAAHHLRTELTSCMWFEGIVATHSEYEYALIAVRNSFMRWYSSAVNFAPSAFEQMPPVIERVLHSYYHRITDPTEPNIDGFYAALSEVKKAMNSGEIKISSA